MSAEHHSLLDIARTAARAAGEAILEVYRQRLRGARTRPMHRR